ncbi:MAG: hypothetical protein J3K34DRAFT_406286 [Monoraphidium minutum]|nr:MAG: hypothetical protein J3K34DRAFT_406286 [Monoraphidium minutum]
MRSPAVAGTLLANMQARVDVGLPPFSPHHSSVSGVRALLVSRFLAAAGNCMPTRASLSAVAQLQSPAAAPIRPKGHCSAPGCGSRLRAAPMRRPRAEAGRWQDVRPRAPRGKGGCCHLDARTCGRRPWRVRVHICAAPLAEVQVRATLQGSATLPLPCQRRVRAALAFQPGGISPHVPRAGRARAGPPGAPRRCPWPAVHPPSLVSV